MPQHTKEYLNLYDYFMDHEYVKEFMSISDEDQEKILEDETARKVIDQIDRDSKKNAILNTRNAITARIFRTMDILEERVADGIMPACSPLTQLYKLMLDTKEIVKDDELQNVDASVYYNTGDETIIYNEKGEEVKND